MEIIKKKNEIFSVNELCKDIIDSTSPRDTIDKSWLAHQALSILDPKEKTPIILKCCVYFDLSRRFGSMLVNNFSNSASRKKSNLEPNSKLQSHYPINGQYIPRNQLSKRQRKTIINRFHAQANSFKYHAYELEAELYQYEDEV